MNYNIDGIFGLLVSKESDLHLITLDDDFYPEDEAIEDIAEEHAEDFEGLPENEAILVHIYHYDDYSVIDGHGDVEGFEKIKFKEIGSFECDGQLWDLYNSDRNELHDYVLSACDEYGVKKWID